MRAAQEAQVMPPMSSVTVVAAGGGGVGHRSHISMSGVPVTGPWSKVNEAVWTVPLCLKSKNRP